MKKGQDSASLIDLRKQKSEGLALNLEKNVHILNELMGSDVSWLSLNKISFKPESVYYWSKEKGEGKTISTIAYAKKGLISVDKKKSKVIIPEAHYYEFGELLDGSDEITRGHNLINNFPYVLYWALQGKHKQTNDWHLFYRIGGFCGPGGIDATSEHASIYVLSGYEKFKKLEKTCQDIMRKEPDNHIDNLDVYPKMPWPTEKELHFLAGLAGPLPLPDIKKLRNLMGISEIDENYVI